MSDAYSISGEVLGGAELERVLTQFPDVAGRAFADALNKTGYAMEGLAKGIVPRHDGQLMDSIHTKEAKPNSLEAAVGTDLQYGKYVEFGTKPHHPPSGPNSALAKWAQDKLGDARLAFLVAKAIAKRGTKGQFFMKKTRDDNQELFVGNMRDALSTVMSFLGGK